MNDKWRKAKAIYILKNSAPVFPLKKPEEYNDYIQTIKQVIDWLEQEPKTGYWVKIKPYPLQMHDYECSECGHETNDNTENYCSDCGAKMIKQQENEDKPTMLIKFIKDFANNWKAGDIVKAKYLEDDDILVDGVAKINSSLLLKHCKIISESRG